jgi:hypothetical protein
MAAKTEAPITYTETEVRSVLPSGWGIVGGSAGRWDAREGTWSIEIYDGAEQRWTVTVDSSGAERGRLGALDAEIRRIERKGLGRKSVISG